MGAAYFYHLTRSGLDGTLATLLAKSREAGWRVAVRGRSEALLTRLDDALWAHPSDGFLPHALAGGAHDAAQPILLTTGTATPNDPACLISVEGANITADEVAAMARVCIVFDGQDAGAVQTAREQWKLLTTAGVAATYWSEETGKWALKAESGKPVVPS